MNEVVREELIQTDPAEGIRSLIEHVYQSTVFSVEVLDKSFPKSKKKAWTVWSALQAATCNYIILFTGIQPQEARALRWKHYFPQVPEFTLHEACKRDGSVGELNNKQKRAAYLPDSFINLFGKYKEQSSCQGPDYSIYGNAYNKPMYRKLPNEWLSGALNRAGQIAKEASIPPYSFRRTYITKMVPYISETVLRKQVGHKTAAMTDLYDDPVLIERLIALKAKIGPKINR